MLPKQTNSNTSNFLKLEKGQTELLIVSDTIQGHQAWMENNTCIKQRDEFQLPIEGIKMVDKKDKDGNIIGQEPDRPQFFWATVVYNFSSKRFEVAQFTQATIRKELRALVENDKWGDPTRKYTVTIGKTGEGFQTRYSLTPNPKPSNATQRKEMAKILAEYDADPMDVERMMFGSELD